MSDSEHKINDELISAYLDGELSDPERSQVEQALSEDAHCRRTWNEMRAIRETLRSLPAYQLGPDFQDKVLRQVDATTRESTGGTSDVSRRQGAPASEADTPVSRPKRNWRGTFWAVGTVAAAAVLLLMLALPDSLKVAELARNDSKVAENAERESDGAAFTESASEKRPSLREESRSYQPRAEQMQEDSPGLSDDAFKVAGADVIHMDVDADVALSVRTREKSAPRAPRPTSEVSQGMSRSEHVPQPTTARPYGDPQPTGVFADQTQEGLSRIAMDRPSAELISDAMQTTGARYLVHVVVNRSDASREAFDRSLANNEIRYKKRAGSKGLDARSLGRSEAERISGVASDEHERFAFQVERDSASRQTARGETPQLVVVNTTTARLRDTINDLTHLRDQFAEVQLYEVASDDSATDDSATDDSATDKLQTGDRRRRMELAMPAQVEQRGFGMAADRSVAVDGAVKTDRALSESLDVEALDSLKEADESDEAGAAVRSAQRRGRARGLGTDSYRRRLDSQPARTQPDGAMRQVVEPTRGALAGGMGGMGGANVPLAGRPASSPTDPTQLGLKASDLAKRVGAGISPAEDSVQVLFVLSPAVQASRVTAAEPAEAEIGTIEPVAEPDENR